MTKHPYFVSGNAPVLYPTETFFGNLMWSEDDGISIPYSYPFAAKWGESVSMHILDEKEFPVPSFLDMIWYSIVENQFYSIEKELPTEEMEALFNEKDEKSGEPLYDYIIVGMAPYGGVAVWLSGPKKSTAVAWLQAEAADVEMSDFCPSTNLNRQQYAAVTLKNSTEAYENLQAKGLPDRNLYEKYMTRFNYRIIAKFEDDNAVLDNIEIWYYNGEFDTTHSNFYSDYAMRAKPCKIVINWKIGKAKYGGYFWTDDRRIIWPFEKFFVDMPDSEMDFVIEVKKGNQEFRFFYSCKDMEEPLELPLDMFQIIVFKDKFESFRSENYDKPIGAWRK